MTTNLNVVHICGHSSSFVPIRAETKGRSSSSECLGCLRMASESLILPLPLNLMHEDMRFPLPNAIIAPNIRPAILGV